MNYEEIGSLARYARARRDEESEEQGAERKARNYGLRGKDEAGNDLYRSLSTDYADLANE